MSPLEYRLSSLILRVLGRLFDLLPGKPDRVVLATARLGHLEGNLLRIHDALLGSRPDADVVLLLEPYSYGLAGKIRYFLRTIRGTYHVRTAGLVVVDNAWLPVHVAPHRPRTTVVQVWHAPGALKRFGLDTLPPPGEPERTFLHRYYDWVVTSGEASRGPWSRALRTPVERVVALGTPRTDAFFDPVWVDAARARILARHPEVGGRRVVLYAPTFRGRAEARTGATGLDASRLGAALGAAWCVVLKGHPNLDPATQPTAGFDVVASPSEDLNDWLCAADVLVTDYSSSIFEWALLRRPLVLLVDDLEAYERDPGLYLDYRTELVGAIVRDTDGVARAVLEFSVDDAAWDAFIARHMGACDGAAAQRFVERFAVERASAAHRR
jgi:CDP-glycerol glycerophosphotransferase (TagB/SpsB family)